MEHFSFVVLHYQNSKDTIECTLSLLKLEYSNFNIIIVDNGSPNNSGIELQQMFENNIRINVLLEHNNLGFAKGNNIGYKYAKQNLNSDFIFLLNNDTIINQPNFISLIIEQFKKEKFHVLGPDIVTLDGRHQNPSIPTLQNYSVLKKKIAHHKMLLFLAQLGIDQWLEKIKKSLIKKPLIAQPIKNIIPYSEVQKGVKLHGSAICFSSDYIKNYEGLYPNTFMYSEEAILYYICRRDALKTIYFPSVKLIHKEDGATDMSFANSRKKRMFYYKHYIDSGQELIKLIDKDKKNENIQV